MLALNIADVRKPALLLALFQIQWMSRLNELKIKMMELHHLKETQGKLWNWKINNNNEVKQIKKYCQIYMLEMISSEFR